MPMESQLKFSSPHNISGASQQNNWACFDPPCSKSPEAPRSRIDLKKMLMQGRANTFSLAATVKISFFFFF